MAGYRSDEDGAANNGFGRRSLHQWEGRRLYAVGYPAPLDFRAPGGWRLSAGGIPIPPSPTGAALDAAIDEVIETMSDEQRADPRFYPTIGRRGLRSSGEGTNASSPPTTPPLLRATMPPAAAAGGARPAAPSSSFSRT
jgi:hypothetical protein